jgi:hypothetical protein
MSAVWKWQNDNGGWEDFSEELNEKLEKKYEDDKEGSCKMKIGNTKYKVDFESMKQINRETKFARKVKRVDELDKSEKSDKSDKSSSDSDSDSDSDSGAVWKWEDDNGTYQKFSKKDNEKLEKKYQDDNKGSCKLEIFSQKYKVDFEEMEQINKETKKSRKVKRTTKKE